MPPRRDEVGWVKSEPGLILILSSERSGSTLLRAMLGEHDRIIAPSELALLRFPDFAEWRRRKPIAIDSVLEFFELLGHPMTVAEIEATCSRFTVQQVYQWLFSFIPSESFLVDKTPSYAAWPDALERSRAYDPYYIWLIRHPLGVMDSEIRVKRRGLLGLARLRRGVKDELEKLRYGGVPKRARSRERRWVLQNRNVREFLDRVSLDRQSFVRFEELVTRPDHVVPALCEAMGLDFQPQMLSPRKRRVRAGIGDPNFHLHDGIDSAPATVWRNRLREPQMESETRGLLRALGYAPEEEVRSSL
jgi:hypothetical protein